MENGPQRRYLNWVLKDGGRGSSWEISGPLLPIFACSSQSDGPASLCVENNFKYLVNKYYIDKIYPGYASGCMWARTNYILHRVPSSPQPHQQ